MKTAKTFCARVNRTWIVQITGTRSTPRIIFLLVFLQSLSSPLGLVQNSGHRHAAERTSGRNHEVGADDVGRISYVIDVENAGGETYHLQTNHNSVEDTNNRNRVVVEDSPPPNPQELRWAEAAYQWVSSLDCKDVFLTTERECRALMRQQRSAVAVHIAAPSPRGRLHAVLPDGGLGRSGAHDAVLVLDPYPAAEYGHLVLVFFVDLHVTENKCQAKQGIFLEQACLTLALKRRCKNALERRVRRRHFARRCEINFLPRVYMEPGAGETETAPSPRRENLLQCRGAIPGFAPCPELRPRNETAAAARRCDPLQENTQRCATTHHTVHTSCRVFEICDQAVILSGGWDERLSLPRHRDNVHDVYHLLREHGFKRNNIHVFFANGGDPIKVTGEDGHRVHSASQKLALRYHVQRLCGAHHCAESLLLYLNSPTRSDGTMLLWDENQDGEASDQERYSVDELLSDLSDCQARRVYVVADQSYSGVLVRALRRSQRHHNVAAFASSKEHQYAWRGEFTRLWTTRNHTHNCMQDVHKEVKKQMENSTPDVEIGRDVGRKTLFGAPCDVVPPFTHRELRQKFLGCQNLPTALWVTRWSSSSSSSSAETSAHNSREVNHRENRPAQRTRSDEEGLSPQPPTLFRRHKGL